MNFYLMVFLISAIYMITQLILRLNANRQPKADTQAMSERFGALEQELARLNQRLQNVETIVTGKDYHLHKAFQDLENGGR